MRFGLEESVIAEICGVFRRHENIEKVVIFGSRAKGCFREGSDIDLALFGENLTYAQLLTLGAQLDDLGLFYKIDLVIYAQHAGTPLAEHIDRAGETFFAR